MQKEQDVIAKELKILYFHPKINKRSEVIVAATGYVKLSKRQELIRDITKNKISKISLEIQKKENSHMLEKLDLLTPCVCGGGPGLKDGDIMLDSNRMLHSDYCLRFMSTCSRNARNKV